MCNFWRMWDLYREAGFSQKPFYRWAKHRFTTTVHVVETPWLSGKEKFLAQQSIKKIILTVFWDMKIDIIYDMLEKIRNCQESFLLPNSLAKFTLSNEWPCTMINASHFLCLQVIYFNCCQTFYIHTHTHTHTHTHIYIYIYIYTYVISIVSSFYANCLIIEKIDNKTKQKTLDVAWID